MFLNLFQVTLSIINLTPPLWDNSIIKSIGGEIRWELMIGKLKKKKIKYDLITHVFIYVFISYFFINNSSSKVIKLHLKKILKLIDMIFTDIYYDSKNKKI